LVLTFASICLVGYHKIVAIAVEQYQRIEDETLRPFSSSAGETASILARKLTFRSKWPITGFTQYVETQVRIRKGKLLDVATSGFSHRAMERLIAAFSDVTSNMSSRHLGGECPFCSAESAELIKNFRKRDLQCSEYIIRQQRIAKFIRIEDCAHHSELHRNELRQEHDTLVRLYGSMSREIDRGIPSAFNHIKKSLEGFLHGPLEQLDAVAPTLGLGEWWYSDRYIGRDCFDRFPAHRWLDLLDQDPSDDDWSTILMRDTRIRIDAQDYFGRTLLHITCQKRWPKVTRLLLDMGADPGMATKFSSFPIHYAAANGSKLICEMLLAHKDKFNIHGTDANGLTAHDYAIRNGCTEVAELLSEHHGVRNVQPTVINVLPSQAQSSRTTIASQAAHRSWVHPHKKHAHEYQDEQRLIREEQTPTHFVVANPESPRDSAASTSTSALAGLRRMHHDLLQISQELNNDIRSDPMYWYNRFLRKSLTHVRMPDEEALETVLSSNSISAPLSNTFSIPSTYADQRTSTRNIWP
jgi:ankyrin repeat protein